MIHITRSSNQVLITCGSASASLGATGIMQQQHVECELGEVFRQAHVSHKIRDYATVKYPKASTLYLCKDRRILSIAAECGQEVEVEGSIIAVSKVLELAGVPYVIEN